MEITILRKPVTVKKTQQDILLITSLMKAYYGQLQVLSLVSKYFHIDFDICHTAFYTKNPAVILFCRGKLLDQIPASDYSKIDFRSIFFLLNFIHCIYSPHESKLLLIL